MEEERAMTGPAPIGVLGPLEVVTGGRAVPVGGRRSRLVLAALVISVNHVVPDDRLIDTAWGAMGTGVDANALQAHVSKLRKLLGRHAIERRGGGYVLWAECSQIDACRFERLARRAEGIVDHDPASAYDLCREALGLWRGEPYGDLFDEDAVHLEAARLVDLRHGTEEMLYRAQLARGELNEAVAALRGAVAEQPYREPLWYLLAEGLAREGRRPEALAALREYQSVLKEIGLLPPPEFADLEESIVGVA